jgi:hypothetical protein
MHGHPLSRRQFTHEALGSLLTFALLDSVLGTDAFASEVKPLTAKWLSDVNQLGHDLKAGQLDQLTWQSKVEELFSQVDLPDLLKLIDFEQLTKNIKYLDRGALSLGFHFTAADGLPTKLSFGRQIFALREGRSVIPHGHRNMATAFLILQGELRGRHYDRLADEPRHYIIRPTIDRQFAAGECSTVSDFKDNVHWFQATSPTAFILNIHVLGVNPHETEATGRLYLDPAGEQLADGTIRAPRLNYQQANQRYG